MTEFVAIIEAIVPIYPAPAPANVRAPYATYDLGETPIRTCDGIAGYEGTLKLSVFCATHAEANKIANTIVTAIDNRRVGNRKYYYTDSERSEYPDVGLVSNDLTFNTLT